MSEEKYGAGWALPVLGVGVGGNAKAHYYSAGFSGQSLCGKYALLGGRREDHTHDSPDNCMACRRKLAKTRPDLNVKVTPRWRATLTSDVRDTSGWLHLMSGVRVTYEGKREHFDRMVAQGGAVLVKRGRKLYSVKARDVSLGKEL